MKRTVLAGCLALAISGCAKPPEAAPAAAPAATAEAAPEPAVEPKSTEKLAWLEGSWCGGEEGESIEETWFPPLADETIGMSRTSRGGRIASFEFMRILDLDGTLTFIAQPSGDEASTSFPSTARSEGSIRFENKKHDYPQRIEYKREGEGLVAEIGGPGAGDKEEVISYRYQRCKK